RGTGHAGVPRLDGGRLPADQLDQGRGGLAAHPRRPTAQGVDRRRRRRRAKGGGVVRVGLRRARAKAGLAVSEVRYEGRGMRQETVKATKLALLLQEDDELMAIFSSMIKSTRNGSS